MSQIRRAPNRTSPRNQRRHQRFEIPIEVEVSGIGLNGRAFHERAVTSNVSEWGCAFPLTVELKADDIIAVRVISTNTKEPPLAVQAMFQVVRVRREKGGWDVAAWRVDGDDTWAATIQNITKLKASELGAKAASPVPQEDTPPKASRS